MLCPLWTRDMDVYATLQKSRLRPHFKRNCTFRTAPFHNFVARAFSYSHPEKPGSWSIAHSLNMLLQVLITFTIVFVFFTIVTVSCCIPFSVLLFPLQQTFEVLASSPRGALVLSFILRPKRQGLGKSSDKRRHLLKLYEIRMAFVESSTKTGWPSLKAL